MASTLRTLARRAASAAQRQPRLQLRANHSLAPLTQLSEEEVMFKDTGALRSMIPSEWRTIGRGLMGQ